MLVRQVLNMQKSEPVLVGTHVLYDFHLLALIALVSVKSLTEIG